MLRLKDLREDHDLLQKDVAEYLNVSQVAYSYYEIEKRMIPFDSLIKLANFYHTSVDYILGLTNEKEPYPRKKGKSRNIKTKIFSLSWFNYFPLRIY